MPTSACLFVFNANLVEGMPTNFYPYNSDGVYMRSSNLKYVNTWSDSK